MFENWRGWEGKALSSMLSLGRGRKWRLCSAVDVASTGGEHTQKTMFLSQLSAVLSKHTPNIMFTDGEPYVIVVTSITNSGSVKWLSARVKFHISNIMQRAHSKCNVFWWRAQAIMLSFESDQRLYILHLAHDQIFQMKKSEQRLKDTQGGYTSNWKSLGSYTLETSQELRMLSPSLFIQGSRCKC